jgi:uncharacterized cupredoxin-like copper-binding protein
MQRSLLTVLVPLAAGLLVAGCGSSDNTATKAKSVTNKAASNAPSGRSSTLSISADPSGAFKFNKKQLAAKAGAVTITMGNPSTVPHAIAVGDGEDKVGQTVMQGGTSTVSVNLKPGKYQFYCPVPGHLQGGMEGTLTVT